MGLRDRLNGMATGRKEMPAVEEIAARLAVHREVRLSEPPAPQGSVETLRQQRAKYFELAVERMFKTMGVENAEVSNLSFDSVDVRADVVIPSTHGDLHLQLSGESAATSQRADVLLTLADGETPLVAIDFAYDPNHGSFYESIGEQLLKESYSVLGESGRLEDAPRNEVEDLAGFALGEQLALQVELASRPALAPVEDLSVGDAGHSGHASPAHDRL